MARPHAIRWTSILAALALGVLGSAAQADPQDGGWNRGREDRSEHRRDGNAGRNERDGRNGHDRPRWRADDSPHYGYNGYPHGYGGYSRSYGYGSYGYGAYSRGYGYPGYDRGYGYRSYRRDDGRDDDAALTIAGGVIGGLIGNHAASPENRAAGTVFGAVIGGVLGHAIGQSNNDDHRRRDWRGDRDRRY